MPAAIMSNNVQSIFYSSQADSFTPQGWMFIIVNESLKTQLADDAVLQVLNMFFFPTSNIS